MTADSEASDVQARLNTDVPHSSRIWNYWLGGKDNFAADRAVGDQVRQVYPDIVEVARASRAFLGRAVRLLAGEAGVPPAPDLGTARPTPAHTPQIAPPAAPRPRDAP